MRIGHGSGSWRGWTTVPACFLRVRYGWQPGAGALTVLVVSRVWAPEVRVVFLDAGWAAIVLAVRESGVRRGVRRILAA